MEPMEIDAPVDTARLSKFERFHGAAKLLPCEHTGDDNVKCSCSGWVGSSPVNESAQCEKCGHELVTHGDLQNCGPEEFERKLQVLGSIERLTQEIEKTEDPAERSKRISDLAKVIGNPGYEAVDRVMDDLPPLSQVKAEERKMENGGLAHPSRRDDGPPFERPSIAQLLRNFVEYKYHGKANEMRYAAYNRLVSCIIAILNRPEFLLDDRGKSRDRINPFNYQRWVKYCNKGTYKMCDIFGRSMLRSVFTLLRDVTKLRAPDDLESVIPSFFKDLDKELMHDLSPIFLEDFSEFYSVLRQLEAELDSEDFEKPPEDLGVGIFSTANLTPIKRKALELMDRLDEFVQRTPIDKEHPPGPWADYLINGRTTTAGTFEPPPSAPAAPPTAADSSFTAAPAGASAPASLSSSSGSGPTAPPPLTISTPPVSLNIDFTIGTGRDEAARKEEKMGILRTSIITNDGQRQSLIWLLECKNIFAKQLPKMPKDYITRLVFDKNHRSLVLLRDNTVIGGICFRTFRAAGFIEIAFCAITAGEQVKGYGTHMMNHLKNYMQRENIYHFLTYADNFAIGYFKKQGFTKEIRLDTSKWKGAIKDYDGGTMMHCVIHPKINYMDIYGMIKLQREAIQKKIAEKQEKQQNKGILGVEFDKNGVANPAQREAALEAIAAKPEVRQLHEFLRDVLNQTKLHPAAWPFLEPVNAAEVPDYYTVIKDPIDLSLIERRLISNRYYITKDIFMADIRRMCENCRYYNAPDTPYYDCANQIEAFVTGRLKRGPQPVSHAAPPTSSN